MNTQTPVPPTTNGASKVTGVSLDDATAQIISYFSDSTGLNNFSAAVRFIVNDWNANCRKPVPKRTKGKTGPLGRP